MAVKFWGLSVLMRSIIFFGIVSVAFFILQQQSVEQANIGTLAPERTVGIASVSELSKNTSPLSLLGTVTSRNEATIRAESGGRIIAVYKKLGSYVQAGAILAELENSTERAQILQAEGAYEGAIAGKDIAAINKGSSQVSLEEAKNSARNAITSTYTILDDAIRTKTDIAWRNPQTREAKLAVTIPDDKLVIQLESSRVNIEAILKERYAVNNLLNNNSDLLKELDSVSSEINIVINYLDSLSLAWNRALADGNASQAAIDGYKASTAGARTSVNAALSIVTGARNVLNSALSATKIAEKTSSVSGVDSGSSADAQVKSAIGNLRAAEARLEKTIIRSPINGTINSLSMNTGDFVSPYTEVAVVSNNGSLEVTAYVTADDANEISVGSSALIQGGATGKVTRIAPALDPKTNKIEIIIGITSGTDKLINGASVNIKVSRSFTTNKSEAVLKIPLSAVKITPSGSIVFTVSTSSTLIAHNVIMGALFGDLVSIQEGISENMIIVTDARGLQEGITVTVK